MSVSDNDIDSRDIHKPYPKDSEIIQDNFPTESINMNNQQNNEENVENKGINDEIQNNEQDNNFPEENNNNDDNINGNNIFPDPVNDEFNNYLNDNQNNEQKENNNEEFNNDNSFKDEDNNEKNNINFNDNTFKNEKNNENNLNFINNTFKNEENNENSNANNNNTFRVSDLSNENNRYSSINNKNNENNENKKDENDFEFEDDNNNNNFNQDNNGENNNFNNNNNNRNSDSFGFRESDLKNNDSNMNHYENEPDKDTIRKSGNSDQLHMNDNDNENEKNKNEEDNQNNLNNVPNNINNKTNNNFNNNSINNINNNNNFNYVRNPYSSNNYNNNYNNNNYNNNNQNGGGFGIPTTTNMNQTSLNFIPQNNNVVNNLNYNYNYSSNYNTETAIKHHPDYDPYYEAFEEFPEDSDGFHIDPNRKGKDSSTIAGIQIANTIMGAGILSIPIVMSYLGFIIGIIIVLFLALSTIYSVNILIRCHQITGKNGYSMFGKITMGKFGSILIKIIIVINNLGICVCYFRIFGEVVQIIVQTFVSPDSYWVTNWHNYIYILIGSVILFAFVFVKNISSLKKVSYLGVIAVLIFTIALTCLLFYKSASNELDSEISWDFFLPNCTFTEAFHGTPTVFLAFLFQFNVFPIYYSMRHRNMEKMMRATKIGVGYSLIIFLIVGIIGFLLYGFNIDDTILDNLSDDMIKYRKNNTFIIVLIIIICISFVITCLTSFPILFLSLRVNYANSLIVCLRSCEKENEGEQHVQINQGQFERKKTIIGEKGLIAISVLLYVFIVLFAILVYKLKTMFTIVGASAGTFIAFILPNVFYIIIVKKSEKNYSLILPFAYLVLGLFFFIIAILLIFF